MNSRKINSASIVRLFTLDMPFEEALSRFIQTKTKEVETNIEKAKKKKPPGEKPGGKRKDSSNVVSLRSGRMRKQNAGR